MTVEIVAELSGNHGGELHNAIHLIDAAALAGADAVKFQCFNPERLAAARGGGTFHGRPLIDVYRETWTPDFWFPILIPRVICAGMKWFSSVFSREDVIFLRGFDCPRYKISSFDVTNLPLIQMVRTTGKPVVISTGMASDIEIRSAIGELSVVGTPRPTILHCVSGYPTPIEEANLWKIRHLKEMFTGFEIGFSDHTKGALAACLAVALGATMIEKHLRMVTVPTADDEFSATPAQFHAMVEDIRDAEAAMRAGVATSEDASRPYRVVR
jgi:sialic acid synthase SpsE